MYYWIIAHKNNIKSNIELYLIKKIKYQYKNNIELLIIKIKYKYKYKYNI